MMRQYLGKAGGSMAAVTIMTLVLAIGLGIVLLAGPGAAAITAETVTVNDTDATLETSVTFSGSTNATVTLLDANGSELNSTTLAGTSGETLVATFETTDLNVTDYSINVSATDATAVENVETAVIDRGTITDFDAANETLLVTADVAGDDPATVDVDVTNESGGTLVTDSLAYDPANVTDNETTLTATYNANDGLTDGNLTATVSTSPATAYAGAWVSLDSQDGGGGLIPGNVAGMNINPVEVVALVVLVVLLAVIGFKTNDQ